MLTERKIAEMIRTINSRSINENHAKKVWGVDCNTSFLLQISNWNCVFVGVFSFWFKSRNTPMHMSKKHMLSQLKIRARYKCNYFPYINVKEQTQTRRILILIYKDGVSNRSASTPADLKDFRTFNSWCYLLIAVIKLEHGSTLKFFCWLKVNVHIKRQHTFMVVLHNIQHIWIVGDISHLSNTTLPHLFSSSLF